MTVHTHTQPSKVLRMIKMLFKMRPLVQLLFSPDFSLYTRLQQSPFPFLPYSLQTVSPSERKQLTLFGSTHFLFLANEVPANPRRAWALGHVRPDRENTPKGLAELHSETPSQQLSISDTNRKEKLQHMDWFQLNIAAAGRATDA